MKNLLSLSLCTCLVLLAGCASLWGQQRQGVSSSLVDYLYPAGEIPPPTSSVIPNISVPARVGIAFVPASGGADADLSEALKVELLEAVKQKFSSRDFIGHIEVIPEAYLRSNRGLATLDQVGRLYGLDVIALVSYDQLSTMSENKASILYWTIVGAYFVQGTENEVSTFVDTAVFDVATKTLLFRAPGTSSVDRSTTAVEAGDVARESREQGFRLAMADMAGNLAMELDVFKERIKTEQVATVTNRPGYSGSGSGGLLLVVLLALLALPRMRS